jgi:hypothetical protein
MIEKKLAIKIVLPTINHSSYINMFSSELAGGQLQCVYSGSSGGYNYLMLYNNDNSPDGSTYFQFVCLVSILVNI